MYKTISTPNHRGEVNILLFPLIAAALFFVISAGLALWAFNGREDYRKNTDQKIAVAVDAAKKQESILKDKQHAEDDKQPLKTYSGPEQFGSLKVAYPKTWSGYVSDTDNNSGQPVDGYFQLGVVPNISSQSSIFALRVQVLNQSYTAAVNQFTSQVNAGKLTATAYAFPKVPSAVGIRYDGTIRQTQGITGSMIVVPLRDKTLEVWTESPTYLADFNTFILPNLSFSP